MPKKSDAPSEKVKKASVPLPKKSDAPSERVKKESGDLDDIKNPLVATIHTVDKKGKSKQNFGGGSQHLSYFRKKDDRHSQQNR